jgi:hypothetical protein
VKYVLIYCFIGKLGIIIDESDFNIAAGKVINITPGQMHSKRNQSQLICT